MQNSLNGSAMDCSSSCNDAAAAAADATAPASLQDEEIVDASVNNVTSGSSKRVEDDRTDGMKIVDESDAISSYKKLRNENDDDDERIVNLQKMSCNTEDRMDQQDSVESTEFDVEAPGRECCVDSHTPSCNDNNDDDDHDGVQVVDAYQGVDSCRENKRVDPRKPINGKVLSLAMDFLENDVFDDDDDDDLHVELVVTNGEETPNTGSDVRLELPRGKPDIRNDPLTNGEPLNNHHDLTTSLDLSVHDASCHVDESLPIFPPNEDEQPRLLTTLHYKSVSTATDDEPPMEAGTPPRFFHDEQCQCYPEDFLVYCDQELPFHETYIDLDDDSDLNASDANVQESAIEPAKTSTSSLEEMLRHQSVTKLDVIKVRQDLLKALDRIHALESKLKTMRAEKLDLLGQMKHLYATLETKEEDFNSFVKSFELKISEGNDLISRLISEKHHLEKANQDLEMKLQNSLDQCVSFNLDLDLKNQVIEQMNLQLENSQVSCSNSNVSSVKASDGATLTSLTRSEISRDWQSHLQRDPIKRSSSKTVLSLNDVLKIHIGQWKANHVLIWLEQDLNMGSYSQQCKENVKSGKVLLSMTDQELDSAFGLQSPIHRKKLRVAIENLNNPKARKFPLADGLGGSWIAGEWLAGLGLPQFGPVFEAQLVDGRILEHITAKELEKNFTMISKVHVSSVLAGIQLLKMFQFDRTKLEEQRQMPHREKHGCLVWTNADVIDWLKEIDLQEYAGNLQKSGIHGALMVLDEKFTVDLLAAELGLPLSKSYLLRHLGQEYEEVVAPARSKASNSLKLMSKSDRMRTLSRTSSSSSSKARRDEFFSSTLSFKGSLGRAFGRKMKKELIQVVPTPEPVRMSTGLLSLFDSPSHGENKSYPNSDNLAASDLSNPSFSAFSSLRSLAAPGAIPANCVSISRPETKDVVASQERQREGPPDLSTPSPTGTWRKSKSPSSKSNKYFSLRAFSASSRSRIAGGSSK